MKRYTLLLSILLALIGLLAVGPARPAAAQEDNILKNLPVSGTLSDGGAFEGVISVDELSQNEAGDLVMRGLLHGTATTAGGATQELTNVLFETTAALSGQGDCDILTLNLGPIHLDLLGLVVDLSPVDLEINAVPGSGNLLGNLLCAVASLLDGESPLDALLGQLTAILGGQLFNLPVSGPLADGGTFEGTLDVTKIVRNNSGQLEVSGLLNGTATPENGEAQPITEQAFTTTAALTQSGGRMINACNLLNLDLGPIHLDLLGLVVDLSEVELDVTAVPGAGNLLGNLLCGVAGLLDGGSVSDLLNSLLDLINQILDGLLGNLSINSGLALARVTGTTDQGDFAGSATITNIARDDAGNLTVDGLLSGTLTRADSTTSSFSNLPFTTSLDLGSQNGCQILTLDLGPIFLNVLGLTVDLSPVTLDITAVPGEGKLLGNLLCAVTGLLDPDTALNNLLNQLTGVLGNGIAGLPVSGPLGEGGTFEGSLDVTELVLNDQGQLIVSGLLNGIATPPLGSPQTITDQPFTVTGALTGSGGRAAGQLACDLLTLDLGPIHLDLLGLVVDLSPVELDITAVPGQGNLLGNLLCAVAGLLDDGSGGAGLLDGLLDLINRILNSLLGNLPVSGGLAMQRADGTVEQTGAFDGNVTISDVFLNDGGQLEVSGWLDGVLTTAGGATRRLNHQRFTAPVQDVSSSQGCDILNLDLGPLNLDLLGLVVDLAPVSLDITAMPGEGNLLGNLLCAVAGLLDPGTGLASLLDQLSGVLGGQLDRLPVTGALADGGAFEGTLDITEFALDDEGNLTVGGLLNGTATPQGGDAQSIRSQLFTTTLSLADMGRQSQAVCDILTLDLGPIHLDLLGLVVDLSPVDLNINAVPGQGNLLGNLLCAVTGLLDGSQRAATGEAAARQSLVAMEGLLDSAVIMLQSVPRAQIEQLYVPNVAD